MDSHAVLTRIAEVLRIDIEEITSPHDGGDGGQHAYPPAPLIELALKRYGLPGDQAGGGERQPGRQMGHLRAMARSAYRGYQATRYEATGRVRRRGRTGPGPNWSTRPHTAHRNRTVPAGPSAWQSCAVSVMPLHRAAERDRRDRGGQRARARSM